MAERYQQIPLATSERTKRCSKCGEAKPLSEFYGASGTRDGKSGHCKVCHNAGVRRWREANAEYVRQRDREWRRAHPDKVTQQHIAQKERLRGTGVKSARNQGWRARHPERHNAHDRLYKAVRDGKITRPDACEECGAVGRVEGHHEDYSRPLDVRWLCRSCHAKVGRNE